MAVAAATTTEKSRRFIVQIQKKTDGPWHEAAEVDTAEKGKLVGESVVRVKGAGSFRVLEVVE